MSHSASHAERRRKRAADAAKRNRITRSKPWLAGPRAQVRNDVFRRTVERMTNRQRSRWSRAVHWGDPTPGGEWVSCPTCDGAGWLDEDAEPLDMEELDERCGAIERTR